MIAEEVTGSVIADVEANGVIVGVGAGTEGKSKGWGEDADGTRVV